MIKNGEKLALVSGVIMASSGSDSVSVSSESVKISLQLCFRDVVSGIQPSSSSPSSYFSARALAHAHSRDFLVFECDGKMDIRELSAAGDEGGIMGDEGMCCHN